MFEREAIIDKNEVIVDEKRRIAVNARNLTYFQNQLYARNYFKSFRPDLNTMDQLIWYQKLKLGENFLNEANKAYQRESFRTIMMSNNSEISNKLQHFVDERNNFCEPFVQGSRLIVDRNWEDSNKLVAYMDKILRRMHKYGLTYPAFVPIEDKQHLEEQEKELAERFFREMRKPPKE